MPRPPGDSGRGLPVRHPKAGRRPARPHRPHRLQCRAKASGHCPVPARRPAHRLWTAAS